MADTKLSRTKIPIMKPQKEEKLGLLSRKSRHQITLRFRPQTLERLHELVILARKHIHKRACRTEILEALTHWISGRSIEELRAILLALPENNK